MASPSLWRSQLNADTLAGLDVLLLILLPTLCLAVRSQTRNSRGRASELESMGWRGARRCDAWLHPTFSRGINASRI
jgi:hypothetical protein